MVEYYYISCRLDTKATGARIKQLRQEKHIKVSDLAEMVGTSENAIFKWQRGESIPTVDNLIVLSVIFEVPIDKIIQRQGEDERSSPSSFVQKTKPRIYSTCMTLVLRCSYKGERTL